MIEKIFNKITYILEMILGGLIVVGIVLGIGNLFEFYPEIIAADIGEFYELFNDFLAYSFILIVGVELILLILNHSTMSILNLMLFIIARKMLIYSETMLDLVFGATALAIVFAIIRYLVKTDKGDIVKRGKDKGVYSASTKLEKVLSEISFDVPIDDVQTIGGLVCSLAEEACEPVRQGSVFKTGNIAIEVVKANDEGLIEEVKIIKNQK